MGKKSNATVIPANFPALLADVKRRIQSAQTQAALAVNAAQIDSTRMYLNL